jgi:adenosine deaminase
MNHHPLDALYRLGFAVTINTDNRLMSGTTLTKELFLVVEAFGYGLDDLLAFQLSAANGSFVSLESKEALVDRLLGAYAV